MNLYSKLLVIATSVSFFCEAIAMPPKLAPGGFEIISSDDESEFEIILGENNKRSRANTVSDQIVSQGRNRIVSFNLPQTGKQKLASLGIRQAESFYTNNDNSVNSSRNQSMLQSFVIDRFRVRQNTNISAISRRSSISNYKHGDLNLLNEFINSRISEVEEPMPTENLIKSNYVRQVARLDIAPPQVVNNALPQVGGNVPPQVVNNALPPVIVNHVYPNVIQDDETQEQAQVQDLRLEELLAELNKEYKQVVSEVIVHELPSIVSNITLPSFYAEQAAEQRTANLTNRLDDNNASFKNNVWTKVFKTRGKQKEDKTIDGFLFLGSGFSVGIDSYNYFDNKMIGILYSKSDVLTNFIQGQSEQRVNTDLLAIYSRFIFGNKISLRGSSGVSRSDIFTRRDVFNEGHYFESKTIGYNFYTTATVDKELQTPTPNLIITPRIFLGYIDTRINRFKEGDLDILNYKRNNIIGGIGISMAKTYEFDDNCNVVSKVDYERTKVLKTEGGHHVISYGNDQALQVTLIDKNPILHKVGASVSLNKTPFSCGCEYSYRFQQKYFDQSILFQMNYQF